MSVATLLKSCYDPVDTANTDFTVMRKSIAHLFTLFIINGSVDHKDYVSSTKNNTCTADVEGLAATASIRTGRKHTQVLKNGNTKTICQGWKTLEEAKPFIDEDLDSLMTKLETKIYHNVALSIADDGLIGSRVMIMPMEVREYITLGIENVIATYTPVQNKIHNPVKKPEFLSDIAVPNRNSAPFVPA